MSPIYRVFLLGAAGVLGGVVAAEAALAQARTPVRSGPAPTLLTPAAQPRPVTRPPVVRGTPGSGRVSQPRSGVRRPANVPSRTGPSRPQAPAAGNAADLLDRIGSSRLYSDYLRDRQRRSYRDVQRDQYRAQRDAMIAGAIVDVIGIFAAASVAQSQAAAPPPPRGEAGRYDVRRYLVQEGYWHEYEVKVPGHVDSQTGERVLPHTQRRQTWVEPVYEERRVWVPAGR